MWTIAAVNKKFKGPLGSYNGLTDVHLAHYFSRPSRKSHLKAAKLKTLKKKSSRVAPELSFEIPTLSNHSSEENSIKLHKLPNTHRKILIAPCSAPITCFSFKNDGHHKVADLKRCLSAKEHSPYIVPLLLSGSYKDQSYSGLDIEESTIKRKRKKRITSSRISKTVEKKNSPNFKTINIPVPQQSLKFSHCKITLLYHGHLQISSFQKNLTKNILIKQQHCGGTPVVIYKGKISANGIVSFFSLDHEGFFFSIIVFLNGIRELKLSSCCIFRYIPGRRFGGQNGAFSIKKVEGGTPCLKCQYQNLESKNARTFIHTSGSSANSDNKENSPVILDEEIDKTDDKSLDDISAAEDSAQANVDVSDIKNEPQQMVDENKSIDEDNDDIEEILDDIHNDAKVDSSSEEHIVDVTNASSIEDEIKDQESSDHSDSQQNISEVSDTYQERKNCHEISIDSSSSEDEGENQHIVTVSVHGSPARS